MLIVQQLNRPAQNCPIRLSVQPSADIFFLRSSNRRSPIVEKWKKNQENNNKLFSDSNGKVVARVEAINLENLEEAIFDPVKNTYVKGELDWDRYYGNYVYWTYEGVTFDSSIPKTSKILCPLLSLVTYNRNSK